MTTNKLTLLILAISLSANLYAGSTNDLVNRARLYHEEITKKILKNNNNFLDIKKISKQKMSNYQTTIEAVKNKRQNQLKTNKSEKAIVFVSFSMPELSLKQIIHDASLYRIPVVIRGLYKNSFRETINKAFELTKENNKGGIAINPRWFREYNIKTVPALVIVQNKGHQTSQASDIVYGNIPIKRALSIIAERGETANIAHDILRNDK